MRIHNEGLALPISKQLTEELINILDIHGVQTKQATLNFRDPHYSAQRGGFHPIEIRLEQQNDTWHLCHITDFCYVGNKDNHELVKELDFDFKAGVFQHMSGVYPIEQASDIYQIWEGNFLHYHHGLNVFQVTASQD